jgi:single-strand DNA-binding protein
MNSVNLTGRLTTGPELHDRSGTQVGRLRLAIQRPRGKDGEDRGADYVDVTTFGRQAEVCGSYLAKGRRVAISGHLRHSEWEAEDGSRRQKVEVVAEHVEFLDAPQREADNGQPSEPAEAQAA